MPRRIIAYHNPFIDAKTGTPPDYPVISDDELERLEDDYVAAARLALEAGFNAVDVKVTHGYLLSELMGAKTREGRYGGSLENRTRFIRNVIGKIRAAVGGQLMLCMRLGLLRLRALRARPANRRRASPATTRRRIRTASASTPIIRSSPTCRSEAGDRAGSRSGASSCSTSRPVRPTTTRTSAVRSRSRTKATTSSRNIRCSAWTAISASRESCSAPSPDLPMVGTGYSWLQRYAINAGAWNIEQGNIAFMGIGRGALAYPDFARDALEKGELDERRVCKTLTYCTFLMRQKNHPLLGQFPTGCPPFDKGVYGAIMKEAKSLKRAETQK